MELYTAAHFTGLQPPVAASFPLCTDSLAPFHWKVFQRPHKGWVVSQLLVHCLNVLEQSPLFYNNPECRRVKLGNAVWVLTYLLLTKSPPLSRRSQSNFPLLPCSCACSLTLSLIADEKEGHYCRLYRWPLFWETSTWAASIKFLLQPWSELELSVKGVSCMSFWLPSDVILLLMQILKCVVYSVKYKNGHRETCGHQLLWFIKENELLYMLIYCFQPLLLITENWVVSWFFFN